MNRTDFMNQLEHNLRKLPKDEILEALQYYEDYFDDIGKENEKQALINLGNPQKVAAQIKAEYYINTAKESPNSVKTGLSTIKIVALAIFASPIALPLAGAAVIVAVSLLICVFALLASLLICGVAFAAVGICSVVCSVPMVFVHFFNAVALLGGGMFSLGAGYLLTIGAINMSKLTYRRTVKSVSKMVKRRTVS